VEEKRTVGGLEHAVHGEVVDRGYTLSEAVFSGLKKWSGHTLPRFDFLAVR